MKSGVEDVVLRSTGAQALGVCRVIQELWSGYGEILRVELRGASRESVVVKHVQLEGERVHPRGWTTDISHQRKLHSYEVETQWYREWASHCDDRCRVPECLTVEKVGEEVVMVLEDLDASGFSGRHRSVTDQDLGAGLQWLANFHATFLGEVPSGLWETGTYWHLDTRPDELQALDDAALRNAATAIDARLKQGSFQTFVHGDAKLANFCFHTDSPAVAAVDFQYVGGGSGMKDVAYFIGSCLREEECERQEGALLDLYFVELQEALQRKGRPVDPGQVEQEWRGLYAWAWSDFHRFLKGWSPGHWKLHTYSERLAREVLASLENAG